jgi:hypothetical protein
MRNTQATAVDWERRVSSLASLVFGNHCTCPVMGTTNRGELLVPHRPTCPTGAPTGIVR